MIQYICLVPRDYHRRHNAASQVGVLSKPSILGQRRYAFEGGMGIDRVCKYCGGTFVGQYRNHTGKYCSRKCRERAYCEANPEKVATSKLAWREANREKEAIYRRAYRKANPEKMRENSASRRARKKNAFVEHVDHGAIYKRDSYICQLCEKEVEMDKQFPDPLSPSIDHILPLSKGGTHEPLNVQLAHLRCNQQKNDRIVP